MSIKIKNYKDHIKSRDSEENRGVNLWWFLGVLTIAILVIPIIAILVGKYPQFLWDLMI